MLIFDNNNDVIIFDNIYAPTIAECFWVLDLSIMDFTLAPLLVLEEVVCPTIQVVIGGFAFNLPATWNMLVADEETMQLDVVEVSDLAGKNFSALIHGPDISTFETAPITVSDYFPNRKNVGPSIGKHQMLCHPISQTSWVTVSPSDIYNKYLKDKTVGDII